MIALYARVSTRDKNQDPENQLLVLRRWCELQGRDDFIQIEDYSSGKNLNRPGWERLERLVRSGDVDTVAVVRIDRAFRSVVDMYNVISRFDARGVRFASATQDIDTKTVSGKLMLTFLSAIAEFDLGIMSERIKEGQHRARREGRKPGRPRKVSDARLIKALRENRSIRRAGLAVGLSGAAVSQRVKKTPDGFLLKASNRKIIV
tara:strand:+ start:2486 stop:3100 length:615 start_codon:yes stop_codon:yes gene_type:complete